MKIGLVLLGAFGLAWPALDNGYPLTFQDSAWYLSFLGDRPPHPGRTIGYSLFADAVTWWPSLWPLIAAQALVTSALIVRGADLVAGRGRAGLKLAALGLTVVILISGLAKYVSWIMADIMTSWLFLAGLIWMLSDRWVDRGIAAAVAALAVIAHNTHLPLALGMAGVVAIGAFTVLPKGHPSRRAAAGLLLMGLLLVAWVPAVNAAGGLGATFFRGSGSLLMYRFIDSGVVLETLDAYCGDRDWRSCAYRDEYARHVGRADGWFLFRAKSPFFRRLGGWQGEEQDEIVAHTFRCCWPSVLSTTVGGAWKQLWRVDSRDGIAQQDTGRMRSWLKRLGWAKLARLLSSRQARGQPVRFIQHPTPELALQAVLAVAAIVVAVLGWRRGARRISLLLASVLIFFAGNAVICSFGSSIHDRYQGRIAWLLPWALTLASAWWLKAAPAAAVHPAEDSFP